MKQNYRHAFNALKKIGVPVYVRDDMDGRFQISAEHSESYKWCDYYDGMYRTDWVFGISPKINQVLRKYGLFAEWINPGEVGVYTI